MCALNLVQITTRIIRFGHLHFDETGRINVKKYRSV